MDTGEFRAHAHAMVDWMADYLEGIERRRVTPTLEPGEIYAALPSQAPEEAEPFDRIFRDFESVILPGMTHWQHPSFFGYFPANASPPSILAEMLTATMGAQCMSWATSPGATELEERVMEWLRDMIGLPAQFTGVIQDTASTATLCAILTARERVTGFRVNSDGFPLGEKFTVYCSSEAHSSIEKAVKIAGIGRSGLRKIPVDDQGAMLPDVLSQAITDDIARGRTPLCVVAAVGTTGSTAIDPLAAIGEICRSCRVYLHVDAAYAGSALLLPEMRWMIDGIECADSFVFNPHKWLFTNFDCSAYFVRDPGELIRTFEILPEYLKTSETAPVNNYRDWGIQLGRRFRALKLWFVIRSYGVAGLRDAVRRHIAIAAGFARTIDAAPDFELLAPVPLATVCFRYRPGGVNDPEELNALNASLLETLNKTGKLFLTHTKLRTTYALRLVTSQTTVEARHVERAWDLIAATARSLQRA
jgi:aromatic-L-amino-acid/L-tryptophan decarboxylase